MDVAKEVGDGQDLEMDERSPCFVVIKEMMEARPRRSMWRTHTRLSRRLLDSSSR